MNRRPFGRCVAVVAALAAGLLTAGCASIPSSTTPQVINESLEASPPPEDTDPRYDAIKPQPGENPIDIVGDYLAVGGSHEEQHAGARAYLTPAGAKVWKDAAGVVAIEDSGIYFDVAGSEVRVRAQQRGRVETDGSYIPTATTFYYVFQLKKVSGEWRIDNPPDGVIVKLSTFERAWRPYNVYFLDSTRTRVVPDVRLFPYPQGDALPGVLVSALGKGPSDALDGAVRSDLEGVRLQSNIVPENDRVRVFLTGLGGSVDTLEAGGFAQLVWTLNQLGVGGVEIYLDDQPVSPEGAPQRILQRFGDWRAFDPDGLQITTPGYFVRAGAVLTTANTPVRGPFGTGDYRARSVGVSTDLRSMAVVGDGRDGSVALYMGAIGRTPRRALTGTSLTPPTWGAANDEVWTVRNRREVVLVPTSGSASLVAPALDRLGPVWSLRLSRDGARVAIVAGVSGRQRLYLGVVVRQNGGARIERLRAVEVGDEPVSDVTWSDALTLVVLVRASQQDSGLYSVSVDGRSSGRIITTSGLPGPPSGTAAAPALPLLAVAVNAVWSSPAPGEPWIRVSRLPAADSAPVYPG